MKKLIYILTVLSFIHLNSCSDAIVLDPDNSVTFSNYFKTEKDFESVTYLIQQIVRDEIGMQTERPVDLGCYADGANDFYLRLRSLDPSLFTPNNMNNSWDGHYRIIAACHMLLDNLDNGHDVSEERMKFYVGQAHFFRAFAYFTIVQRWGDAPLVTSTLDIGAKERKLWTEILEFAIEEALKAEDLLPTVDNLIDSNGRSIKSKATPAKGSANALLAHMYAWKASLNKEDELWSKAEEHCTKVIESGDYFLADNPEEVCSSVLVGNGDEGVFEIDMHHHLDEIEPVKQGNPNSLAVFYATYPLRPEEENKAYLAPLLRGLRIYHGTVGKMFPADDLRREAYFYDHSDWYNDNAANLKVIDYNTGETIDTLATLHKWRVARLYTVGYSAGRFWNVDQNKVIWRLAGIYLLRAECRVRQGKDAEAISDLNEIRNRANAKAYLGNEGDLRYSIFKEREKELLLEGHRYFDVLRNDYWKTELSDEHAALTDQDIQDGAFYSPVHNFAFQDNPKMRQTAYWLKRF